LVAHVRRAMARQAEVHEYPRAALKRRSVGQIDVGLVEPALGGRAVGQDRGQQQHEGGNGLSHLLVTLSGSGLVGSLDVYHGISRKNRKYRIMHTCAQYTLANRPRSTSAGLLVPR